MGITKHNLNPEIIDRIIEETYFRPSKNLVISILEKGSKCHFPSQTQIITPQDVNENLYLIIKGIARIGAFDGNKEVTYAFGRQGTFFLSPNGFCNHTAAFFFWETCVDCEIIMWTYSQVMEMINESHEFTKWIFSLAMNQYQLLEVRESIFTGTAAEKYEIMFGNSWSKYFPTHPKRQEIVRSVPAKILASYLKITPEYLSNIKSFLRDSRKVHNIEDRKSSLTNSKGHSNDRLSKNKSRIEDLYALIRDQKAHSSREMAESLGVSIRTIKNYLKELQQTNRIRHEGSPNGGNWVIS